MADWKNRVKGYRVVKASELTPNDKNWRKHPKRQKEALGDVLDKIGWIAPVIYNVTTGRLIDGHLRQSLDPNADVPVVDVELSEDEERVALATFDPIGAMAEADNKALEGLLTALSKEDETLAGLLSAIAEDNAIALSDGASVPDVAPQVDKAGELRELWGTERGQIWVINGVHRVMCGDSTNADDVARLMGGKRASVVITDPPYGMDLDTDFSTMQSKLFKGKTGGNYHDKIIGDNVDFDPSPIFEFWGYCKEIFLWGCDYYADKIPNRNGGAIFVWDKRLDESADKMWGSSFELCWSKVNHKRDIIRVKWAGIFGMEKQDTKNRVHPTQKPTDVIKWIIERYCDPIAITIDPFLGSGTTLIACAQTGRVCYGMEISPEYVAVVLQRAKDAGMSCELMRPTPSPSPLRGEENKSVSDGGKIG